MEVRTQKPTKVFTQVARRKEECPKFVRKQPTQQGEVIQKVRQKVNKRYKHNNLHYHCDHQKIQTWKWPQIIQSEAAMLQIHPRTPMNPHFQGSYKVKTPFVITPKYYWPFSVSLCHHCTVKFSRSYMMDNSAMV